MPCQPTRRAFLAGAIGTVGTFLLPTATAAGRRPPNVVLILADDLGWTNLGCYGGEAFETPNIDRLARDGIRFTQAYSNCPVCSPSRVAILTGKTPARARYTGHITNIDRHRHPEGSLILPPDDRLNLPLEEVTLAEALKPAGYVSASIGKWHIGYEGYWPKDQGFDVNVAGYTRGAAPSQFFPYKGPKDAVNRAIPTLDGGKPGEYLADRLTDEAIRFVNDNKDRPFFLYLPHYAVHNPQEAPADLVEKYERKFAGKDTGTKPVYAAMVENLDTNVGRLVNELGRLGLTEDTVVIFTSDNGGLTSNTTNAPLRNGKTTLYEGGIRVPLIVKWPGRIPEGLTCDEPVQGADLYPTIVSVGGNGAKPGGPLDGLDLAPLWQGTERLERDALYWYYPHYGQAGPGAAVRRRDLKLIEFYDPPKAELFNLSKDESEKHDLAKEMPDKVEELLADLHGYLRRVDAQMHTLNPDRKAP